MRNRRSVAMVAAVALALVSTRAASAHKMLAAAQMQEDGSVLIQAFFPDGRPAKGVDVEVFRPDGSRLCAGQTDDAGMWTVRPDAAPGQWTAVLAGNLGHRTEVTFDIGGPAAAQGEPKEGSPGMSVASLPARAQAHPRGEPFPWRDVLAGLGFIFGLSALLMCLKLRAELKRLRGA